MAERKPYLLRLPADVAEAMQRWARDDLRSVNAQIEFVLRDALRRRGRIAPDSSPPPPPGDSSADRPPQGE